MCKRALMMLLALAAGPASAEQRVVDAPPQQNTVAGLYYFLAERFDEAEGNPIGRQAVVDRLHKGLCDEFAEHLSVTRWYGYVEEVGITGLGFGTIALQVDDDFDMVTAHDDTGDTSRLIRPGTDLFRALADLRRNDIVRFSATLAPAPREAGCIRNLRESPSAAIHAPMLEMRLDAIEYVGRRQ